ncbi:hypothetical protein J53TS2_41600 [Paenibacillus sp. J53TS2]|nr:hypothetical protein J53TS2_41600 [Paenibacillus sp. J53TS2]
MALERLLVNLPALRLETLQAPLPEIRALPVRRARLEIPEILRRVLVMEKIPYVIAPFFDE